MKNIFTICCAIIAIGFIPFNAQAGKGIFEAPMVAVEGECATENNAPECDESEGKVERDGDWKVEINGVPAGDYKVCLEDSVGVTFLKDTVVDEEGELKATEDPGVPNNTYANARLVVYSGGTDDTCDGTVEFTSGFVLNNI